MHMYEPNAALKQSVASPELKGGSHEVAGYN